MRGRECVVRMLHGLGVDVVFCLCGSPSELHEALRKALILIGEGPALLDVVVQQLQEAQAPVSKWVA